MTTTTPDADKPVPAPPAPAAQITATATATATAEPKRVRVRTTLPALPLPPSASRPPIRTARLVLRPATASAADLAAVHALRSQPAVMASTAAGRPDRDLRETRAFLDRFLPPRDADTFNFVILLAAAEDGEGEGEGEGELIGTGGVHRVFSGSKTGWPEVGYMFARRHWGRGYATEFLRACAGAWWALPREERELEVDAASVAGWDGVGEVRRVPEMVTAIVDEGNPNSAKVLRKVGFGEFKRWTEPDSREGYGQRDVTLIALSATAPGR
ncbi:acetyltransferase domain-containing protein [Biscogniauxia mediterranea]|nr:acetyltransferase domain-containing protein [Biscogniauxia mediterranea]